MGFWISVLSVKSVVYPPPLPPILSILFILSKFRSDRMNRIYRIRASALYGVEEAVAEPRAVATRPPSSGPERVRRQ